MALNIYGIPNCDTVKKARAWLDANGVEYRFRDFKKEGADPADLARWADRVGWEVLLNRRGTTFRKLDESDKADLDRTRALALMASHPSLIKRPVGEGVGEGDGVLLVGFDATEWGQALC